MPSINTPGEYNKDTPNWGDLRANARLRNILIDGASVGTSLDVGYVDDEGTTRTFEEGSVTSLPYSRDIEANVDVVITAVGATDVNVTIGINR